MRTFSSVFISVIFVATLLSAGVLVSFDYARQNSENEQFSASVDANEGTNYYTLIEIDEGDNNEEESVTSIYHEFVFTVTGEGDSVSWDFGDGLAGNGMSISHQYETPGIYTVTATSISPNSVKTSTLEVLVDLEAVVEVDNMECTCAPTAKDSVIDLLGMQGTMSLEGYVMVEHDGSSESCTLRNPLQECHLRVILERTEDGSVVSQDILFDDTFRTNEVVIDFLLPELEFEQGEGIQMRLETDQLRDWHKPMASWSSTAPV